VYRIPLNRRRPLSAGREDGWRNRIGATFKHKLPPQSIKEDVRIGLAGGVLPSLTPVCWLPCLRGPSLEFANAHLLCRTA
jgi:hypothetical protein